MAKGPLAGAHVVLIFAAVYHPLTSTGGGKAKSVKLNASHISLARLPVAQLKRLHSGSPVTAILMVKLALLANGVIDLGDSRWRLCNSPDEQPCASMP